MTEKYKKILFELQQDEDGYPPDKWESLWAYETAPGLLKIDNIPIFVKGISNGDIVAAERHGDQFQFKQLIQRSANSVFRLYLSDPSDASAVRQRFRELGCESEQSDIPKLIAVDIPGSVRMKPVAALLDEGLQSGRWEYEEGVLRHST